jgi:anhydro-N-acetylmuramic acid kinase
MDGIDAALVDVTTNTCLHGITRPYDAEIKILIEETLRNGNNSLGHYAQLNTLIGREFAKAVLQLLAESGYSSKTIIAIGSHGQTMCHDTSGSVPYTVQLGCAHTLAEMTGITVVADFRTRDLVVGGQGAPFAPIYHQAIFKDQGLPLAVVNVGGISNLTWLANHEETSGYDLGPGNCLMDAWTKRHLQKNYDKNGEWAASGQVIKSLLTQLLQDDYFQRLPPKSIGKEYFSLEWLNQHELAGYEARDVQATLLELTAAAIAQGIKTLTTRPGQVFLCGGGAHNLALRRSLSLLLNEVPVLSTNELNVNPDFVEAMMFAWLAEKNLTNKALNWHPITGAKHPAILGAIYPAGLRPF